MFKVLVSPFKALGWLWKNKGRISAVTVTVLVAVGFLSGAVGIGYFISSYQVMVVSNEEAGEINALRANEADAEYALYLESNLCKLEASIEEVNNCN